MGSLFTTSSPIELRQLRVKPSSAHDEDNHSLAEKRSLSLELELQGDSKVGRMKFSHSIQFNAIPDWSSHYIAYSNLKKL